MRCQTCGIECRTVSETETLRFVCRNKKCPDYGHVMGEKTNNAPTVRTNYPQSEQKPETL